MYDLTPDVEARLDGQGQPGNVFRVYFGGRIFDILHSPLGPWSVWTNRPEKVGEYKTYGEALSVTLIA